MSRRRRRTTAPTLTLIAALAMGSCSRATTTTTDDPTPAADGTSKPHGTITVSAAASLAQPFEEIVAEFERTNPAVDVVVNLGSSTQLAAQIVDGAPVDVAAFASREAMSRLVDAGAVDGRPRVIATNQLTIVTKPGNPDHIASLDELAESGTVAMCAETAPCGAAAAEVLDNAGVVIAEDTITRGADAGATLAAVVDGDAVAGIVYASDAVGAGTRASTVPIPTVDNVVVDYPIATVKGRTSSVADAFVAAVASADGRRVLADAGFGPPTPS